MNTISQAPDSRYTPHGHTAADARREKRILVRVTLRAGQASQMLPDGRGYGAGTHELEIYESDLPNLEALLETHEHLVAQAAAIAEERIVEFCAKNRSAHADVDDARAEVLSRKQCGVSVPAEFRLLKRDRDLLPVTKIEVVGELEPIGVAQARADDERIRSSQTSPEAMAAAMVGALRDAGLVSAAPASKSR